MAKSIPFSALLLSLLLCLPAVAFQVDLETSLQNTTTNFDENKFFLKKAGLGLTKTISDNKGDRLKLYFRGEVEDNFTEKNIEQIYMKYKGPMGKWNATIGRSLIPFGLITDYNSEMLILSTQEKNTIGHKSDDGIKITGFWKALDYELFICPVTWLNHHNNSKDKMVVLRTSYKGYDVDDYKIGFSVLSGEILGSHKNLYGIDITKYKDLLVSRNEFVIGNEGDNDIASVFSGLDYALFPKLDLNLAYTYFKSDFKENSIFCGITYNTPFNGAMLRMGNKYFFTDSRGRDKNEIHIQIYKYFNHYF